MAITGASLLPIYERLNGVNKYHPMNANTFSDWSIEAGDIVTMSRDGVSSASPVHSAHITWKGSPVVTLNSVGQEKRDSIARVSRQKYGRSGAGMTNNQAIYYELFSEDGKLKSELLYTESILRTAFVNADSALRSEFEVTASHLRTAFAEADGRLRSEFEITASNLRTSLVDYDNRLRGELSMTASQLRTAFSTGLNSVHSEVVQTASTWNAKISGVVDSNGNVTAASIGVAINDSGSGAYINADHIYLSGTVKMNDTISVDNNIFVVKKDAVFNSKLYVYNHNLDANNLINLEYALVSATVSNNTLTINNAQGQSVTFSKATTQRREAWSSGHLQVKAYQTNAGVETAVSTFDQYIVDSNLKQNLDGSAYTSGDSWYVPVYYKDGASDLNSYATGLRIHVDASAVRTAGKNDVTAKTPYLMYGGDSVDSNNYSSNTVYASTNGRPTEDVKSLTLHLKTDATWSGGSKTILVRKSNSSNGEYVMKGSVSIPAVDSTNWVNTSGNTYRADISIGGVTRSSGTKDFSFIDQSSSVSVDVNASTYNGGNPGTMIPITATADNGKSNTKYLYIEQVGNTVYVSKGAWHGQSGYTDVGQVGVSSSHNVTIAENVSYIGTNTGTRTSAGSISKSTLTANSYLGFAAKCGGSTKYFYIAVNA